jgi:serpin B
MMKERMLVTVGLLLLSMLLMACTPDEDGVDMHEPVNGDEATVEETVEEHTDETADAPDEREAEQLVDDAVLAALTADQRDFAFSLLRQLGSERDDNLFVSPYSIAAALAMVYAGADGDTREQMAETLQFPIDDGDMHAAFHRLGKELAARAEVEIEDEGDAFRLDVINQTWGHETFEFERDYLDLLAKYYGAGMRQVDFRGAFEAVRQEINDWVADQTEQRIEDLLPPQSLNEDTRFVLVNAIYFLGSWKHAFEEDRTEDRPFTRLDGSAVEVAMMRQTERFGHHADERTVAVSMPYIGNQIELVAMMPANGSGDFEGWADGLDREHFDEVLRAMNRQEVALHFPRFESGSDLQLADLLRGMGMTDAFDECAADFRGITGVDPCIPDRSIYIDEIFHKSFVDIDESGTEAAAATAVVMMRVTAMGPEPVTVRFDRPFYYFIHDRPTGTILFAGRMLDPTASD